MVGREACIAVYILASASNGTLYIGVTGNLGRRLWEHREGVLPGFTKRYGVKRLVWCAFYESMLAAIQREKSLKKYKRDWKINLIERDNPHWDDLYPQLFGPAQLPVWPEQNRR